MLSDPREIEIISRARQKNVRDPGRSREHFRRRLEASRIELAREYVAPVSNNIDKV